MQIHRLLFQLGFFFVKLGQADDITHQGNEALRLLIYLARETAHIGRLNQPVHHDLGISGNRGERRFQLVDIGGKFPAKLFPALLLGHIEDDDHRTASSL